MITSPAELWKSLCSSAGLELRLSKGKPGRDADIEESLRLALDVPDSAVSLEVWLEEDALLPKPSISTETLLVEILKSQNGFAQMMQDILDVLIEANAVNASNQLSVEFKFDDVSDPLKATLEQFRATVLRTRNVLEKRPKLPDSDLRWSLFETLRRYIPNDSSGERPKGFPPVESINKTGHQGIDAQLDTIAELVSAVRGLWCKHGETRSQVFETARKSDFPGELLRLCRDATDFWDIGVLQGAQEISAQLNSGQQDHEEIFAILDSQLSRVEWSYNWVSRTFDELLDILNLPAWKRRHELYSVWIGTRLLVVVQSVAPEISYHTVNDVLSFAFGGSRLATFNWNNKQYDVWAELRSTLVGKSPKRKKGIQPDFRILQVDISQSIASQTTYVLECKHYLSANKKNFTQAVKDYATSCPQANVQLINHGPADERALKEVLPDELQQRASFIGDATPLRERSKKVVTDSIKKVLFPELPSQIPEVDKVSDYNLDVAGSISSGGYIDIDWDDTLSDIDLSLQVKNLSGDILDTVDFRNHGSLDSVPFARLKNDVRTGPGKERIDISRWSFDVYRVLVTNYSEVGVMTPSSLSCKINVGDEQVLLKFPLAHNGKLREWQAAEILICNGSARIKAL